MKCPHCLVAFHETYAQDYLNTDIDQRWEARYCICPTCRRLIIQIGNDSHGWWLARPKGIARNPLPPELTDQKITSDYTEACLVLSESAKASAALSRASLQYILRENAGVKHTDLSDEIQQVIDSGKLPSDLADNLDHIRAVGNFASHPIKSKSSGEIVEVEPGEAEWNLDVLEELIDFYYVRPMRAKVKRDSLNAKLADAGKPALKTTPSV